MKIKKHLAIVQVIVSLTMIGQCVSAQTPWNSKWLTVNNEVLSSHPDADGNIIPDFSRVGYFKGETPPDIDVTITLEPQEGDNKVRIQNAINEIATKQPDANGFRGCLLLREGIYNVSDQLTIAASGIVIRGEGSGENGTTIIATGKKQYSLFQIKGEGSVYEIGASRDQIKMDYVPVGSKKIAVKRSYTFNVGDEIMLFRPGSNQWISDLKMDQIAERSDGEPIYQWKASEYDLHYERKIEKIIGDTLLLDYPVVMAMENKYGGGYVYKYRFEGRIYKCGIENILLKSEYASDTDESHGWDGVKIEKARDCWVRNVVAKHFGYSAVNIASSSRNISVLNCKCIDAKSKITGGRRYSFNCNGQLNLFRFCETSEGRHDFVTGARVCGPNVFTRCRAINTHSDIGPHHRWATGTLFDMIETDGVINVQDRGNWGTGHGWSGANQYLWNCKANEICVQNPWASAKNYAIGCAATKMTGRLSGRPDGEWEGLNTPGLMPESLYDAQIQHKVTTFEKKKIKHKDKGFSIYRNNGFLQFSFNPDVNPRTIEIFKGNGQKLKTFFVAHKTTKMQVPFHCNGVVIVKMVAADKTYTHKIAWLY